MGMSFEISVMPLILRAHIVSESMPPKARFIPVKGERPHHRAKPTKKSSLTVTDRYLLLNDRPYSGRSRRKIHETP